MKKERTIKELLQLLLSKIENGTFKYGLCRTASDLYHDKVITFEELKVLYNYIDTHRPSLFSSWDAFNQNITEQSYYWTINAKKPRVKWLKKHIRKN
jgi:hypothetical protein